MPVHTAEIVQAQPLHVGKASLGVADQFARVERLVGGERAHHAAAAADAFRDDGDGVLAGGGDGAVGGAVAGGDADNTAIAARAAVAADAHRQAPQRAADGAAHREIATAAADALREDAERRDTLHNNGPMRAVDNGDGTAISTAAAVAAHAEWELDLPIVVGRAGRGCDPAAAATAAHALGGDTGRLRPERHDRAGVGRAGGAAIASRAAFSANPEREVQLLDRTDV